MSRRIFFCFVAAAFALIATRANAEPHLVQFGAHSDGAGTWDVAMHGFPGHGGSTHRSARGHGRKFRSASGFGLPWGWPAYALPYAEYPTTVGDSNLGRGNGRYHGRRDCRCGPYGYHPFGIYGERRSPPVYVLAPSAKIISIDQDRR